MTYDNDWHIDWYDDEARKFDKYGVRKLRNASGILIAFKQVASNTTWESYLLNKLEKQIFIQMNKMIWL